MVYPKCKKLPQDGAILHAKIKPEFLHQQTAAAHHPPSFYSPAILDYK